ncbi:hypothetical protein [Microcoleus sp. FACHB-672]|uniref:hypothetical protein n=1 Tax=Microcoleus sp. FACHB-672 TaxID=2692825 RepID=UPI0016821B3F|nr:hypothetical protein [Microcoleus sp. FACHB-672]MBD2039245.1 hypothetical protein [Microcoleus sp. FACHB-672]
MKYQLITALLLLATAGTNSETPVNEQSSPPANPTTETSVGAAIATIAQNKLERMYQNEPFASFD